MAAGDDETVQGANESSPKEPLKSDGEKVEPKVEVSGAPEKSADPSLNESSPEQSNKTDAMRIDLKAERIGPPEKSSAPSGQKKRTLSEPSDLGASRKSRDLQAAASANVRDG